MRVCHIYDTGYICVCVHTNVYMYITCKVVVKFNFQKYCICLKKNHICQDNERSLYSIDYRIGWFVTICNLWQKEI